MLLRLSIIALCLLGQKAYSCSCDVSPNPCLRIDTAQSVFVGRIVSVEMKGDLIPEAIHTVAVEESIKGSVKAGETVLLHGGPRSFCGVFFEVGSKYLILAAPKKGSIAYETGSCWGNRLIHVSTSDFIDRLLHASREKTAFLTGRVEGQNPGWPNRVVPISLSGVSVIASSGARTYRAISNAEGVFEIEGLPPGRYELQASFAGRPAIFSDEFSNRSQQEVTLGAGSCRMLITTIPNRISLKGSMEAEGQGHFEHVEALLAKISELDGDVEVEITAMLNRAGEFVFGDVSPGEYYLLVRPRYGAEGPTIRSTYYPSALDRDSAQRISIPGPEEVGLETLMVKIRAHKFPAMLPITFEWVGKGLEQNQQHTVYLENSRNPFDHLRPQTSYTCTLDEKLLCQIALPEGERFEVVENPSNAAGSRKSFVVKQGLEVKLSGPE
jgi:hypothetical protein